MPTIVRFDCFEVDLAAGQLLKRGAKIPLREQCFQVLAALVERPGEVLTREDLRRRLWADGVFVDFDNNLNSAIARLRDVLGDSAERPRFIETLPKHGYRFIGSASEAVSAPAPVRGPRGRRWRPAAGREVPETPWVLEEKLGEGGFGEVWLARHRRLKEPRVFKFCVREDRVRALEREMTLFRVWRARVGDHPHLVQLLGVNLDQPPFYLEEEYVSGRDLRRWCAAQGGVEKVPIEVRLELVAQAAEGLAAAHEAGIIHRDIKPGNILVGRWRTDGAGEGTEVPVAKLTDFGIGHVRSAEVLAGITATGLTGTAGPGTSAPLMGTHAYLAPEVLMGRPATVQSDVYSMGVVLYQLLVGDFTQPVTTDWAREIPDAVWQEDLQRCFAGRPEERFESARELAEHLRSVPARRAARADAAGEAVEGGAVGLASAPTGPRAARLIVLPFVNTSGDPALEYFSDAVTDEIITELAGLAPDRLAVIARTTAMRFKGTTKDIAAICRQLSTDYAVEGSVRRADDRVTINVQVIHPRGQTHRFAKRYDAPIGDLFATEHVIARTVAEQLGVVPAAAPEAGAASVEHTQRQPTRDLVAYNTYIQGRYHLHRASPDDIAKAKQLFEDAIRRDPHFTLADDGLADVCFFLGFNGLAAPREVFSTGLFHALRAFEIDNTLAETQALVAQFRAYLDYNWPEVERGMRRAIELNPASPVVRVRHAQSALLGLGCLDESVAELERALEWDPLSAYARMWLAVVLWLGRHTGRAIDEARLVIELDPTYPSGHLILGLALIPDRRLDEAIASLRKAVDLFGGAPFPLACLGFALALSGNVVESRQLLERFRAMADQAYVAPTNFVWIHLGLGDIDEAFAWMDKAVDVRDPMMVYIRSYWFFDPIRNDPRFHALLRKMNLE